MPTGPCDMKEGHRVPLLVGAALLFGLFIFLSLNWHSHSPKFTYHSEIWADRAGYHVYLPATFDYAFDPRAFPAGIDSLTGSGFSSDHSTNRIITKYPYGVALLQAPFYLLGKVMRPSPSAMPGYTPIDHAMIDIAASFYGAVGLVLLLIVLRRRSSWLAALLTVIFMLVGTNLLYYVIGEPGMSHVYSFFLFSAFLALLDNRHRNNATWHRYFLLGVLTATIFVTRPTNIIFIAIAGFVIFGRGLVHEVRTFQSDRLRTACFALGFMIIILPQMIYWQYAFGSPIKWSYTGEGFTNWASPQVVRLWFSPYNGLFTYSPLILGLLLGSLFTAKKSTQEMAALWVTFILVSYISASWHVWTFGCGFGARSFVEYAAVFAFPLNQLLDRRTRRLPVLIGVLSICCIYTMKLTYSYPTCWFGGVWDWDLFLNTLFGPPL